MRGALNLGRRPSTFILFLTLTSTFHTSISAIAPTDGITVYPDAIAPSQESRGPFVNITFTNYGTGGVGVTCATIKGSSQLIDRFFIQPVFSVHQFPHFKATLRYQDLTGHDKLRVVCILVTEYRWRRREYEFDPNCRDANYRSLSITEDVRVVPAGIKNPRRGPACIKNIPIPWPR